MKVKELLDILKDENQEAEVIMSSDSEGNKYSPLAEYESNLSYIPYNGWSGEIKFIDLTEELIREGYEEEHADVDNEGVKCLVLYPTN